MNRFTIAIDGPAAAGKGTISKAVAAALGYAHLDTGLLYRAVGAKTLLGIAPMQAAVELTSEDLQADGLRSANAAQAASKVAVIPEVRAALLDFQRAFAGRQGGAVLDGRDIGTVICPDAEVKLFVTASPEVRAKRRWLELQQTDPAANFDAVLAEVKERDHRDMHRADAPLRPAEDAVVIDTSDLDIDEAVQASLRVIESKKAVAS